MIKETLTKSALINLIAEQNDIPRKTAIGVFNTLESVMLGSVRPRSVGEFTLQDEINLRLCPVCVARTRSGVGHRALRGASLFAFALTCESLLRLRIVRRLRTT